MNWFVKGVKNNMWCYNVNLKIYNKIHKQNYSTSLPVHLKIFLNILYTACSCRSAKSGGEKGTMTHKKDILNVHAILCLRTRS